MLILSFVTACSDKANTPNDTEIVEDTAEEIVEDTAEDTATTEEEPLECSPLSVSVQWTPEHFSISFETYDELGSYYLESPKPKPLRRTNGRVKIVILALYMKRNTTTTAIRLDPGSI